MLKEATYGEFSSLIHQRMMGRRAPVEVSIEVTRRCPLECLHCYNNLPMGDEEARRQEMTFEEHCRLLDELMEMGCLWILYTGGEIFARKDFLEIYTEAKKRGFLITLFTNGTLITERVADHLAEYRPFVIEITLYGATRETYEALTGIPGSYDRCMRGIRLLKERNLPLKLKTVPTTINHHEVFEMKRLAEEELGVEFKFDPLVNPRIDCSQSPLNVRLTPEEVVALDFRDPVRRAGFQKMAESEIRLSAKPLEDEADGEAPKIYTCGAGQNGCAVDPKGFMTVCVLSHQDGYSFREGGFRAGWEGRLAELRNTPRTRRTICTDCQIQSLCGMCAANAELESGDAESPVEFLCQVAHLRAYVLGLDVPEHGDCPCCAEGKYHESLKASAQRLQQRISEPDFTIGPAPAPGLLPVLQAPSGCGGGCRSCSVDGR